jgi:hypothetical protein
MLRRREPRGRGRLSNTTGYSQPMLQKARARWAQRKKREQQLDEELAAEERALLDDPDELNAELDRAQAAGPLGFITRRLPREERRQ